MLNYHLYLRFFHQNDHYKAIDVSMLIYLVYYRIRNSTLQLKPRVDYKYDKFIVPYDQRPSFLLMYEQATRKQKNIDNKI